MHPEETQTRFEPVHVDRRKLPRLILRTPARVVVASGEKLTCTVRDVSPDGLQLRCNRAVAAKVHPSGRAIREGEPPVHVQVTFAAPTEDGNAVITLLCRLAYLSVIAPDVVAIGLNTVGASKADRDRLQRVFSYQMRPRDDDRTTIERGRHQIKGAGDRLVVKPRTPAPQDD